MQTYKLWSGRTPVKPETIPLLDTVSHVMVHRARKGHYQFLLGADIVEHKGDLLCAWGNSEIHENDSGSIMAGRRSTDGGRSWGEFEVIAPGSKGKDAHSHGVLCEHRGRLYALAPRAEYNGQGAEYPNLRTELFVLDEQDNRWKSEGIVIDEAPFWPMNRPLPLENGNTIMPGLICTNGKAEPAVAISNGNTIRQWRLIRIATGQRKDTWGEGGLIIDGSDIHYIFRNGWSHSQRAQVALSGDYGETWTPAMNTNIPMAPAKPCCGMLSTGQKYLVFNPAGNHRDSLAIAVSEPGGDTFSKIWRIRHGAAPQPRWQGKGKSPQWAYPLACEHRGKLCVVYTVAKEDCLLAAIPLKALR
jgi:hypothetical protein